MNNTVIKVLTEEHGKQVIQWWKDQGVYTRDYIGNGNEKDGDGYIYYGVINDYFNNYSLSQVKENNATIIELPTPSRPEPKFNIGDVVNTNNNGFQYVNPLSYNYNVIKDCNVKSWIRQKLQVTNKEWSDKNNRWWYKFEVGGNWYEECTLESIVKSPTFNLANTKIWIGDNPELCRQVQEKAFELGYTWYDGEKTVKFLQSTALYFDGSKRIGRSSSSRTGFFSKDPNTEITPEQLGISSVSTATPKEDDLLEEARRRYPIGTRFKCVKDGEEGVSIAEVEFYDDDELFSRFAGRVCNQYVYLDGKWAEIVTPKEETPKFIIGKWYTAEDCYGKLSGEPTSGKFPSVEWINHKGTYFNTGEYFSEYEWKNAREVDLSEIQAYLPDGHPDKYVTASIEHKYCPITFKEIPSIPVKENLVGRYIKALVGYPSGGDVKQGEIGVIKTLGFDGNPNIVDFPSQKGYLVNYHYKESGHYELMPKDYTPLKPTIQVGHVIEDSTTNMIGRWVKVIKNCTTEKHPVGSYLQMRTEINHLDCFNVYGFFNVLHTAEVEIMPEVFIPPAGKMDPYVETETPWTRIGYTYERPYQTNSSKDSIRRIEVKKRAVKKLSIL